VVIGRIPILDVQPVLDCGRRPAKAVTGETFEVSATVFREGHEMLGAAVALFGPGGKRFPLTPMRELAPGTDRYGAEVTVTAEGHWQFQVEAWGDPIAHWRHDAEIKVPRGLETELMLAEGAILFERAARAVRASASPGGQPPGTPRSPLRAEAAAAGAAAGADPGGHRSDTA
jgi:starch synthase (maltosyl-transferring)